MGIRRAAVTAVVAGAGAGVFGGTPARADPEFAISLGYTHVSLDETSIGEMAEQGGFRFEPRLTVAPFEDLPQLRVGGGMGFSFFYDETDGTATLIDDDGDVFLISSDDYENLFLWTPEFQLSWRQTWDNGLVLEGGVGVGGVFGYYTAGDEFLGYYDQDIDEGDITWSVRPFVRGGYRRENFTFGLETAYLVGGNLDFGPGVGGDVEQFYLGGFFGWSW